MKSGLRDRNNRLVRDVLSAVAVRLNEVRS